VIANLNLNEFAATLGADNSTGAVFAYLPCLRAFCHVVLFPFFWFALGNPHGFSPGKVKLLQAVWIVNNYF
jgi:hypothetical protein